jgi:uncharacterized protein
MASRKRRRWAVRRLMVWLLLSHAPGLLAPMISAMVVTEVTHGRAGLWDLVARMARWRVRPRWHVWAIVPLVVPAAAAAMVSIGPARFPDLAAWTRMRGSRTSAPWALSP